MTDTETVTGIDRADNDGADGGLGMRATVLFASTALILAITAAGMRVSGWRAGSLDDRVEWIFWAGAILAAVGTGLFGYSAVRRAAPARPLQVGMALFLLGPVLCLIAIFGDYWI